MVPGQAAGGAIDACCCIGLASGFVVVSGSTSSMLPIVRSLAFLLSEPCGTWILHHEHAPFRGAEWCKCWNRVYHEHAVRGRCEWRSLAVAFSCLVVNRHCLAVLRLLPVLTTVVILSTHTIPVLLCARELARHATLVRCVPPAVADPAGLDLLDKLAVQSVNLDRQLVFPAWVIHV